MSTVPDLPPWAALSVALLLFLGSTLAMIGGVGLVRLRTFYSRTHAPTMGSSGGMACIALAGMICFSALDGRIALEHGLIFLFVTLTLPVTLILLSRAALFRDRVEGSADVPPPLGVHEERIAEEKSTRSSYD